MKDPAIKECEQMYKSQMRNLLEFPSTNGFFLGGGRVSLQPGAHCGVQIDVKRLSSCLNSPSVYTATSGGRLF